MTKKRIKLVGKTQRRIKVTSKTEKPISPEVLAVALGAKVLCETCGDLKRAALSTGVSQDHAPCSVDGCGCSCRDQEPFNTFLINVGWARGTEPMIFQGRISADTGLPIPDPLPTQWEMAEVAAAAKKALLRVLRTRKRAK